MESALTKFLDQFESGSERLTFASWTVAVLGLVGIIGIKVSEAILGPFQSLDYIDQGSWFRAFACLASGYVSERMVFNPMVKLIRHKPFAHKTQNVLRAVSLFLVVAILLTSHGVILGITFDAWARPNLLASPSELLMATTVWVGTAIFMICALTFLLRIGMR